MLMGRASPARCIATGCVCARAGPNPSPQGSENHSCEGCRGEELSGRADQIGDPQKCASYRWVFSCRPVYFADVPIHEPTDGCLHVRKLRVAQVAARRDLPGNVDDGCRAGEEAFCECFLPVL